MNINKLNNITAKLKRAIKRQSIKKICPICNKEFIAEKTLRQKYCSKECAHEGYKIVDRKRHRERYQNDVKYKERMKGIVKEWKEKRIQEYDRYKQLYDALVNSYNRQSKSFSEQFEKLGYKLFLYKKYLLSSIILNIILGWYILWK